MYQNLWSELDKIEHQINQLECDARNAVFQDKNLLPAQMLIHLFDSETQVLALYALIQSLEINTDDKDKMEYRLRLLFDQNFDLEEVVRLLQSKSEYIKQSMELRDDQLH